MTANTFYYEVDGLTLLFRVDRAEECAALGALWGVAFGAATDLVAITERLIALYVRSGHPSCAFTRHRGDVSI